MEINIVLINSRSFTFEINNTDRFYLKNKLEVKIGKQKFEIEKIVNSVYDLEPETNYTLEIYDNGELLIKKDFITESESFSLNVKRFGAKGDGVSNDTLPLQTAIMSCPKNGRVYIPKGKYLVTSLFLKNDITIELAAGAEILGDTNRDNFGILPGLIENEKDEEYYLGTWEGNPLDSFSSIITGINIENVKIIGEGVINGQASKENWWNNPKIKREAWRPRTIFLNKCKNITIEGVTIKNSPSWTVHPFFSENLKFINLKIQNPADSPNTDGIDPESCKNVEYIGIDFSVGDDCIAIKSGKLYLGEKLKTPSENFQIRNCLMKYGHGGVVIGSEMSGGVKNINIEKCIFYKTDKGIRVKTRRGRGEQGVIDGIIVKDVYMDEVKVPFVFNSFYFCDPDGKTEYVYTKEKLPVDKRTPHIKNLEFENIVCIETEVCAGFLYGLPEKPIENIKFKNINISFTNKDVEADYPAMMSHIEKESKGGFFIANAENVKFENVVISGNIGEKIRIQGEKE